MKATYDLHFLLPVLLWKAAQNATMSLLDECLLELVHM